MVSKVLSPWRHAAGNCRGYFGDCNHLEAAISSEGGWSGVTTEHLDLKYFVFWSTKSMKLNFDFLLVFSAKSSCYKK